MSDFNDFFNNAIRNFGNNKIFLFKEEVPIYESMSEANQRLISNVRKRLMENQKQYSIYSDGDIPNIIIDSLVQGTNLVGEVYILTNKKVQPTIILKDKSINFETDVNLISTKKEELKGLEIKLKDAIEENNKELSEEIVKQITYLEKEFLID